MIRPKATREVVRDTHTHRDGVGDIGVENKREKSHYLRTFGKKMTLTWGSYIGETWDMGNTGNTRCTRKEGRELLAEFRTVEWNTWEVSSGKHSYYSTSRIL